MILTMFYMMSLLLFTNFSSPLMVWMLMEINMLTFILMIVNLSKEKEKFQVALYYFMIQTLGSMMFLTGLSMESNSLCSSKTITILALILKMGLYPMEKWMYKMSKSLENNSLIILITAQKIPIMMILFHTQNNLSMIIMITSLIMGSILIVKSMKMKELLISSSIYSTMWMILSLNKSMMAFMAIYFKYSMASMMLMKETEMKEKLSMILLLISTMFMLGLPPFEMFFMKMFILGSMTMMNKMMIVMILWGSTFTATYGYFKMLFKKFMKMEKLMIMKTNKFMYKKMIFLFSLTAMMLFM